MLAAAEEAAAESKRAAASLTQELHAVRSAEKVQDSKEVGILRSKLKKARGQVESKILEVEVAQGAMTKREEEVISLISLYLLESPYISLSPYLTISPYTG